MVNELYIEQRINSKNAVLFTEKPQNYRFKESKLTKYYFLN